MANSKKTKSTSVKNDTSLVNKDNLPHETSNAKRQHVLSRPEDYSASSFIARAYSSGYFPNFSHQKLFLAIITLLDGKLEGNIDFNSLLAATNMHRSSALQIIRHMVNWHILHVSFNSSHAIGQKRQSWLFVRIIKNLLNTQDADIHKSA